MFIKCSGITEEHNLSDIVLCESRAKKQLQIFQGEEGMVPVVRS